MQRVEGCDIGSIDGQIRRAQEQAQHLREKQQAGEDIARPLAAARRRYVGLFRLVFERELTRPAEEEVTADGDHESPPCVP